MLRFLALSAVLSGCGWNHLPGIGNSKWLDRPLWDPTGVVATTDGVYVPLPRTGQLAFVGTDGSASAVDLRPGIVSELVPAPDPSQTVAFVQQQGCPLDGPAECDPKNWVVNTQVALLASGGVDETVDVPGAFNSIDFSNDGTWAIAWLDLNKQAQVNGVVSLSSVVALDLTTGEATTVNVGFSAERVLFTDDDTRAVVLSQNQVAVVDLTASPPARSVTFPLVLDPNQTVVPVGVTLTPDGSHALISVQGSSDLYVLDLDNPSVNLVTLDAAPSAMVVDGGSDQTVITFASAPYVDFVEHQFFDVTSMDLAEPMSQILHADGTALLWNQGNGHTAYRLDVASHDLLQYRLQNPAVQMFLAPTEEYAVALTRPEGGAATGAAGLYDTSPGLEVLDLRTDHSETLPYLLEGQGIGAAFVATDTSLTALVLQQGIDYLYAMDLYTNQAQRIDLDAPPIAIGTVPGGPFYITNDDGTGMISFYDPQTGQITEAAGFATQGALNGRPFDPEAY